jgi:flagellin
MRIVNNTAAFNVWSSYTKNVGGMQKAMQKLSTGMISNTDDPAGIGISERMRAQIEGSAMARQNVDNAISMIQTTDAWLQKVNDQISRMKALSIEAAGVMSAGDRANVQTEFRQMQSEITRITSKYNAAGKFNGLYLFRGGDGIGVFTGNGDRVDTSKQLSVQIGADINQTFIITLKNLDVRNTEVMGSVHTFQYNAAHSLTGSSHISVQWGSIIDTGKISVSSNNVIGRIDLAVDYIANTRAQMAAQQNRLENTREGLLTYEDNLRAAESKIRDVDMANESTAFAKYQILTNASNAMLAQANQLPASVLQLLG